MMKTFIFLVVAQGAWQAWQVEAAVHHKCLQGNGYWKSPCGVKGSTLTCCTTKEVCIGPIKTSGSVKYACDKTRKLAGSKLMKIICIPVFFLFMDFAFLIYMALKLNINENHVVKCCACAIALSGPLMLSSKAHFAIFSAFLAMLVAMMSNTNIYPRWIYRTVWLLQMFQVVVMLGPNEAFHVPLYNQSTGSKIDLVAELLKITKADCGKYFHEFFGYIAIEKEASNYDSNSPYWGFCTEEFLGVLQVLTMMQGLVWMASAVVSAPVFLVGDDAKVEPDKKA